MVQWTVNRARATRDRDYVPASGDSSRVAGERFRTLLEELARLPAPQPRSETLRILLVSHGGVTVDLLRTLYGDDAVRAAAPDAIERGMPACGITVGAARRRVGTRGSGSWGG